MRYLLFSGIFLMAFSCSCVAKTQSPSPFVAKKKSCKGPSAALMKEEIAQAFFETLYDSATALQKIAQKGHNGALIERIAQMQHELLDGAQALINDNSLSTCSKEELAQVHTAAFNLKSRMQEIMSVASTSELGDPSKVEKISLPSQSLDVLSSTLVAQAQSITKIFNKEKEPRKSV